MNVRFFSVLGTLSVFPAVTSVSMCVFVLLLYVMIKLCTMSKLEREECYNMHVMRGKPPVTLSASSPWLYAQIIAQQ